MKSMTELAGGELGLLEEEEKCGFSSDAVKLLISHYQSSREEGITGDLPCV